MIYVHTPAGGYCSSLAMQCTAVFMVSVGSASLPLNHDPGVICGASGYRQWYLVWQNIRKIG